MRLCLSCRQLSSDRDLSGPSLFCPHCSKSFGVKRCHSCKKKPSSPLDATYCVHCGTDSLTEATPYLQFGWLAKLFLLGCAYFLVRCLWPHLASTSAWGPLLLSSLTAIIDRVIFWLILFSLWYLILCLVPGTEPLRKVMIEVLRGTWHFTFRALATVLKWTSQMLLGMVANSKVK
jgi:hypothetical protein